MAATVDHLCEHQWVKVLEDFQDAAGNVIQVGETGQIADIRLDWTSFECELDLVIGGERHTVVLGRKDGPRNGNLKHYFAVVGYEVEKTERKKAPPDSEAKLAGWMRKALTLERENRLQEAEQCIEAAITSPHFALDTAEMYRLRRLRLLSEERFDEAREAWHKAADWAFFFASQATSGGEGAALSRGRDQFLRLLGPEDQDSTRRS